MTPDSFLKSKINYFIMNKKEKNSILDIVERFFADYANYLTEDSKIFFKLLELDSGVGYLGGKAYHCYDMINIDEIKAHLKEIFIETLITYKNKQNICAFIITTTGAVAINLSEVPNNDCFFLEKKLKDYESSKGKDIAAKIIVFLLHEIYGHKKFLYDKKEDIISPYYFIQDNKIYFLDYIKSISKDPKAIKILQKNNCSDDGTYFELSYGKMGDYYAIEIIDKMDEYGDLLDDIKLWTDDLDTLNDYFKYKWIIKSENIVLNYCPTKIRDKIDFYKTQVLKAGIDIESFYKKEIKEEKSFLNKKRNLPIKDLYLPKSKDSYDEFDSSNNENEEEKEKSSDSSIEDIICFDFDSMTYKELKKLYYSGKLKGDCLDECFKRISDYQIQSKII